MLVSVRVLNSTPSFLALVRPSSNPTTGGLGSVMGVSGGAAGGVASAVDPTLRQPSSTAEVVRSAASLSLMCCPRKGSGGKAVPGIAGKIPQCPIGGD